MKIEDAYIGQMVVLTPSDEHGRVSKIDYDEDVIYVDVAVKNGIDTIDMDPSEVEVRA